MRGHHPLHVLRAAKGAGGHPAVERGRRQVRGHRGVSVVRLRHGGDGRGFKVEHRVFHFKARDAAVVAPDNRHRTQREQLLRRHELRGALERLPRREHKRAPRLQQVPHGNLLQFREEIYRKHGRHPDVVLGTRRRGKDVLVAQQHVGHAPEAQARRLHADRARVVRVADLVGHRARHVAKVGDRAVQVAGVLQEPANHVEREHAAERDVGADLRALHEQRRAQDLGRRLDPLEHRRAAVLQPQEKVEVQVLREAQRLCIVRRERRREAVDAERKHLRERAPRRAQLRHARRGLQRARVRGLKRRKDLRVVARAHVLRRAAGDAVLDLVQRRRRGDGVDGRKLQVVVVERDADARKVEEARADGVLHANDLNVEPRGRDARHARGRRQGVGRRDKGAKVAVRALDGREVVARAHLCDAEEPLQRAAALLDDFGRVVALDGLVREEHGDVERRAVGGGLVRGGRAAVRRGLEVAVERERRQRSRRAGGHGAGDGDGHVHELREALQAALLGALKELAREVAVVGREESAVGAVGAARDVEHAVVRRRGRDADLRSRFMASVEDATTKQSNTAQTTQRPPAWLPESPSRARAGPRRATRSSTPAARSTRRRCSRTTRR